MKYKLLAIAQYGFEDTEVGWVLPDEVVRTVYTTEKDLEKDARKLMKEFERYEENTNKPIHQHGFLEYTFWHDVFVRAYAIPETPEELEEYAMPEGGKVQVIKHRKTTKVICENILVVGSRFTHLERTFKNKHMANDYAKKKAKALGVRVEVKE